MPLSGIWASCHLRTCVSPMQWGDLNKRTTEFTKPLNRSRFVCWSVITNSTHCIHSAIPVCNFVNKKETDGSKTKAETPFMNNDERIKVYDQSWRGASIAFINNSFHLKFCKCATKSFIANRQMVEKMRAVKLSDTLTRGTIERKKLPNSMDFLIFMTNAGGSAAPRLSIPYVKMNCALSLGMSNNKDMNPEPNNWISVLSKPHSDGAASTYNRYKETV